MIQPHDAWQRLVPHLSPLAAESVPRTAALGRVLAADLSATLDVPAADVSAMDGFALAGAPSGPLPVAGRIVAGDAPGAFLAPGTAWRIMTGAPVPLGADRVIPVERATVTGEPEQVHFATPGAAGDHVRQRGEVMRTGDLLLSAGSLVTPGALSLLATHGYGAVPLHRRPRVAVLVTGDEVVPPEQAPPPGSLRDSHSDFLTGACAGLAAEVIRLGIAADRPDAIAERLAAGLAEADVVLSTGGVSMGELDFVEDVLTRLDCRPLLTAVAIQPGKPLVAATAPHGQLVFALPGNPASVMVCFWLFVRPALRRLAGYGADGFWHGAVTAELAGALPGAGPRERFVPAEVVFGPGGRLLVRPLDTRGSHDLGAYAHGTALARIPAGSAPRGAGGTVEVLPLVDWRGGAGG